MLHVLAIFIFFTYRVWLDEVVLRSHIYMTTHDYILYIDPWRKVDIMV